MAVRDSGLHIHVLGGGLVRELAFVLFRYSIPFGGHADLFSAQGSPPKVLSIVRGLLNNIKKSNLHSTDRNH
jgi:hypothetical protein